jgi:hypothetical protein
MISSKTNRLNSHWLQACVLVCAMLVLLLDIASGQDAATKASCTKKIHMEDRDYWNQFRGPNGQAAAQADRIPIHFSPESNVLWKTVTPAGHSCPVIWNNRIFLTASEPANKQELMTLVIDRENGKILWRGVVQVETKVGFHPLNNPASSTPAADERNVYVYFGTYGLE